MTNHFSKICLIFSILSIYGCSSSKEFINEYINSNPENGIIIYDKEISTGLNVVGGKALGRHFDKAKKHCSKYNKKALYEKSGSTEKYLGSNEYKTFEQYKCISS